MRKRTFAFQARWVTDPSRFALVAFAAMGTLMSACLSGDDLFQPSAVEDAAKVVFDGCVGGYGVDANRIMVLLEAPRGSTRMNVYRDGELVGTVSGSTAEFLDTGLQKGYTYKYSCEAIVNHRAHMGTAEIQLSTLTDSAPDFAGITAVTALGGRAVRVSWSAGGTNGIPVAKYRIYANMGTAVDWTRPPRAEALPGAVEHVLDGLADEVGYSFGVRACAVGNLCDVNAVDMDLAIPDAGAPTSQGIVSVTQVNGKVLLSVPWSEANGGLSKRIVYSKTGAAAGTDIAQYPASNDFSVTDIKSPPAQIELTGLLERTQYHFLLVDEDPSAQRSVVKGPVSFTTSDLTLPVFSGAGSVQLGTDEESSIAVEFTGIARESVEDAAAGASEYVVYLSSASHPLVPPSACTGGTESKTVSAAAIAQGEVSTISVTGLTPRTTYSVCLKARDSYDNTSATSSAQTITTRDNTVPSFDGIQSLSFDRAQGQIVLAWNPSTSADVTVLKAELWLNSNPPVTTSVLDVDPVSNASGIRYGVTDFAFNEGDVVYAIVNACDNAGDIPGGTDNCTAFTTALYRSVSIPDYSPPPDFPGISAPGDLESTVQGQVVVKWGVPPDWSEYRGFRIHEVLPDDSLRLLQDCPCPAGNCATPSDYTQCAVTGLEPNRVVKFHVRAYDAAGNETPLDPTTSQAEKRVIDTTPPSFSSELQVTRSGSKYVVSYAAATDNQHVGGPDDVVTYAIYRKAGTTFANPSNPAADGAEIATTRELGYTDEWVPHLTTQYYAVCASDASGNRCCDGLVRQVDIPDLVRPVIASFTSDHAPKRKRWTLSWAASDNLTSAGNLSYRIYAVHSDSPTIATVSDALIFNQTGVTTAPNLTAVPSQKKYVNYLLQVEDKAGNISESRLSLIADNRMTVTAVRRSSGPAHTAKTIVIRGTGFALPSENGFGTLPQVLVGGQVCTNVKVYDSYRISCITPLLTAGSRNVQVIDPDGSSATLAGGYLVQSTPSHVCDLPATWEPKFAKGSGTLVDPFIICDLSHFDHLRENIGDNGATLNYRIGGYAYKLGENIDFEGSGFLPIPDPAVANPYFFGVFDGDGLALLNFNYTDTAIFVGLFRRARGDFLNLDVLGFDVTGPSYTGALTGGSSGYSSYSQMRNIHIVAAVTGAGYVGALWPYLNTGLLTIDNVSGTVKVSGASYVGGLLGTVKAQVSNVRLEGQVTATGATVGGVAGQVAQGGISDTSSMVTVSGVGDNVGGVVGQATATLSGLYATGPVSASGAGAKYHGGLVGNLQGSLSDSRFEGTVSGGAGTGGAVGYTAFSTLSDVEAGGWVNGASSYSGGVVGYHICSRSDRLRFTGTVYAPAAGQVGGAIGRHETTANALCPPIEQRISNVSATGYVTALQYSGGLLGLGYVTAAGQTVTLDDAYANVVYLGSHATYQHGGLIGQIWYNGGTDPMVIDRTLSATRFGSLLNSMRGWLGVCTNCPASPLVSGGFWDQDAAQVTLGYTNSGGVGFSGAGLAASTTADLTDSAAGNIYETAGWDFTNVWKWPSNGINDGYPILQGEDDSLSSKVFSGLTDIDEVEGRGARLNWIPHESAVKYVVYDVTSGSPVKVKDVQAPAAETRVTGLSSETSYRFRVRMLDRQGRFDANTSDRELLMPALSATCYGKEILADAPLVYLDMNEREGTLLANKGSAPGLATLNGGLTLSRPSPVANGAGIGFDGSTGYIEIAAAPVFEITGSQTVEFWVKKANNTGRMNPYNKAYGGTGTVVLEPAVSADVFFYMHGTSGSDGGAYQPVSSGAGGKVLVDTWAHVVAVRDLTAMQVRLYLNGVQVASVAASYPAAAKDNKPIWIGRGYAGWVQGDMDEFALYDKAISADRVQAHFNAATCGQ